MVIMTRPHETKARSHGPGHSPAGSGAARAWLTGHPPPVRMKPHTSLNQEQAKLGKNAYQGRPGRKAAWLLVIGALWALGALASPAGAEVQSPLRPGLYRLAQGGATCSLSPLNDRSWQLLLWQGDTPAPAGNGFAFLGRLVPDPQFKRLALTWQALPDSCCPGQGRGELEVLGPDRFRFSLLFPSVDQAAWTVRPEDEFTRVGDLAPQDPAGDLNGTWRVAYWYTDLLPNDAPADLVTGQMTISPGGEQLQGMWQGRPGTVALTLVDRELLMLYSDVGAGYQQSASLRPVFGGLAWRGPFHSSLGQGVLQMVRRGLPADPPGPGAAGAGDLSGVWVDPRTGSDFFEITGSAQGFDFLAYGGSKSQPRYLTRGAARPEGPQRFSAQAKDEPGHCCGNQGRLRLRLVEPNRLEVRALWWPLDQNDPGGEPGDPYVIQRVSGLGAGPSAPPTPAGRWPLVNPAQPGAPALSQGAVRVRFTWQPLPETKRIYTLFSQGGYLRDLDIFIDLQGRPGALVATAAGPLRLVGTQPAPQGQPCDLWFIYQKGGQARLVLNGQQVAASPMTEPWTGSNAPYLVGASRWPARAFAGDIERVDIFAAPQDPGAPGEPTVSLTPPPPPQPTEVQAPTGEAGSQRRSLLRLWHPRRLVHAYVVDEQEAARMTAQGFVRQGPVGSLAAQPGPGLVGLWAFHHRGQGYVMLRTSPESLPGCDSLGLMGYAWSQPQEDTVPLYELKAEFPRPLRGGRSQDLLYTSSPETLKAAARAGYQNPTPLVQVGKVAEPAFSEPLLQDWGGTWRGEGWGQFHFLRKGDQLLVFWYYGRRDGPHYLGRYDLSSDGSKAQGFAVGRPGPQATYYRHQLELLPPTAQGPRLRLRSTRLMAPLDDGRRVLFKKPQVTETVLQKLSQRIAPQDLEILNRFQADPAADPDRAMREAINESRRQGRLLER